MVMVNDVYQHLGRKFSHDPSIHFILRLVGGVERTPAIGVNHYKGFVAQFVRFVEFHLDPIEVGKVLAGIVDDAVHLRLETQVGDASGGLGGHSHGSGCGHRHGSLQGARNSLLAVYFRLVLPNNTGFGPER
jgi:hypothetical protein